MRREGADGVEVSDDPALLDVDWVHRQLSERAYWALGRSRDVVERSIAHSIVLGGYRDGRQLGFARLVTDRATFAWLCDVVVDEVARSSGLGTLLVACAVEHPAVRGCRMLLATAPERTLYDRFGFEPLDEPSRWRLRPARPH